MLADLLNSSPLIGDRILDWLSIADLSKLRSCHRHLHDLVHVYSEKSQNSIVKLAFRGVSRQFHSPCRESFGFLLDSGHFLALKYQGNGANDEFLDGHFLDLHSGVARNFLIVKSQINSSDIEHFYKGSRVEFATIVSGKLFILLSSPSTPCHSYALLFTWPEIEFFSGCKVKTPKKHSKVACLDNAIVIESNLDEGSATILSTQMKDDENLPLKEVLAREGIFGFLQIMWYDRSCCFLMSWETDDRVFHFYQLTVNANFEVRVQEVLRCAEEMKLVLCINAQVSLLSNYFRRPPFTIKWHQNEFDAMELAVDSRFGLEFSRGQIVKDEQDPNQFAVVLSLLDARLEVCNAQFFLICRGKLLKRCVLSNQRRLWNDHSIFWKSTVITCKDAKSFVAVDFFSNRSLTFNIEELGHLPGKKHLCIKGNSLIFSAVFEDENDTQKSVIKVRQWHF